MTSNFFAALPVRFGSKPDKDKQNNFFDSSALSQINKAPVISDQYTKTANAPKTPQQNFSLSRLIAKKLDRKTGRVIYHNYNCLKRVAKSPVISYPIAIGSTSGGLYLAVKDNILAQKDIVNADKNIENAKIGQTAAKAAIKQDIENAKQQTTVKHSCRTVLLGEDAEVESGLKYQRNSNTVIGCKDPKARFIITKETVNNPFAKQTQGSEANQVYLLQAQHAENNAHFSREIAQRSLTSSYVNMGLSGAVLAGVLIKLADKTVHHVTRKVGDAHKNHLSVKRNRRKKTPD